MLLAIDIGNTSISFGIFNISADSSELLFTSRISSSFRRSSDEYIILFDQILKYNGFDPSLIDCTAVSSVVPHLTDVMVESAEIISSSIPYIIAPGMKTGFKIDIYDPADLGADIVANVAGALNIVEPPFVVLDAGTANTLAFVDAHKNFVGTVIAPGLRISSEALSSNAELLESITINDSCIPLIGKNTDESIKSGLVLGNALMIDGIIRNIREKYVNKDAGEKLSMVATGGYCDIITEYTRNKFVIEKSLTLRGIAALYVKNCLK